MEWIDILTIISRVLTVLLTVCYFYQFLYLFVPLVWKKHPHKPAVQNRYAVLIAARNEEAVLPHLLDSLAAQDYPPELVQVFVVADNCTDRTAEVARAKGATVFSRSNQAQVGKGYAIAYLLEQIEAQIGLEHFDAFLLFDADNVLASDFITQINRVCSDGYDVFGSYRNTKNFGTNWLTAGHGLMFLHEACHLNQSRMLLGTGCMVGGTGFGFTRQVLQQCGGWRFFTLTEDLEFGAWCASNGVQIGYCHDAVFYDEQPEKFSVSWRQRTRWVQGGVQVGFRMGIHLLRGLRKPGWIRMACLENLTLTLWGYALGTFNGGLTVLCAFLTSGWQGLLIALLLSLAGMLAAFFAIGGLTLWTEWHRIRATKTQKLLALFAFPVYMLSFLPIAATALFRKYRWPPIVHTAAISMEALEKK